MIFYVRGFNSPYTEGHITVVRNIVKALSLANVSSHIFNFKYRCGSHAEEDRASYAVHKYERSIPFVDRDSILHRKNKMMVIYASLAETCAGLRFLATEKRLRSTTRCVANVVNCFRFPRVALKELFAWPTVLHLYMRSEYRGMTRAALDMCDEIIVSSKGVARYVEMMRKSGRSGVEVIYPPVDTSVYRPMDKGRARATLNLAGDHRTLLYIGGLQVSRFPDSLVLELLRHLTRENSKTQLVIFAPENSLNMNRAVQILRQASQHRLEPNVLIRLKDLSDEEKRLAYNGSDVLLFPSLDPGTAIEPPLTILEAMSCGLPVVSNDVSSVSEVIANGVNGSVLPFAKLEISRLSEEVSSVMSDDTAGRDLSGNARRRIEEMMSLRVSSQKLAEVYDSVQ